MVLVMRRVMKVVVMMVMLMLSIVASLLLLVVLVLLCREALVRLLCQVRAEYEGQLWPPPSSSSSHGEEGRLHRWGGVAVVSLHVQMGGQQQGRGR